MDEKPEQKTGKSPNRRWALIGTAVVLGIIGVAWKIIKHYGLRPSPQNAVQNVVPEDIAVYQTLLTQVADGSIKVPSGEAFVVVTQTPPSQRIQACVNRSKYDSQSHDLIPSDDELNQLRSSLIGRNRNTVELPHFQSSLPLKFAHESHFSSDSYTDLHFSLPAYSADGSTALIYFYSENDSSEDAGSIFVLRRDNRSWIVDHQDTFPQAWASVNR